MNARATFEIHDGKPPFADLHQHAVGVTERAVRRHRGWESVRYRGKRYQLFGGIRTPLFINLRHPLKGRAEL